MVKALKLMDYLLNSTSPLKGQTQMAKSLYSFYKPWFLYLEKPLINNYEKWVMPEKSKQKDLLIFLESGVIPFVMQYVEKLDNSHIFHFIKFAVL